MLSIPSLRIVAHAFLLLCLRSVVSIMCCHICLCRWDILDNYELFSKVDGVLWEGICVVGCGVVCQKLSSCILIHARLRYAAGTELFVQGVTSLFRARYARVFGLRSGALGGLRRVLKNCILRLSMISIWFLSKLFVSFKRKSFHPYVICSNYQLLVNFLCVAPLTNDIRCPQRRLSDWSSTY